MELEDIPEHTESPNPISVPDVELVFANRKEWPENSAKYFQREHNNPGDGKRGLVVNSISDKNRDSDFSRLSDKEMYYHLHAASVHKGITHEQSKDVCQMTKYTEQACQQEMKGALEATNDAYKKALHDALVKVLDADQITPMVERINKSVKKKMETHYAVTDKAQMSVHPTDRKRIRTKYTLGENSIMKSLPVPAVGIMYNCAHVPINQIVNHFLAFERDVSWYRAGHEDDWKCNNGNYDCKFTAEVHDSVMKLMKEDPETIPKCTRICFGRVWSDGFEAHHIVAKNGYSSLQLFTLSLVNSNHRITKCNTWPCALCFKKDNSPEIFCHILEEIHTLRKPAFRYWGRDKQLVPTIVYLQMVCQDYPERCYCTCMSDLGKYTHRWGHSSQYDNGLTPSCGDCEWNHIQHVLKHNDNQIDDCSNCQDWWNTGRKHVHGSEKEYPISPADAVKQSKSGETIDEKKLTIPSIELSFELWENSIKVLEDWMKTKPIKRKGSIPKIVRTYLMMMGVAPKVAMGLGKDIANGINATESEWYPLILRRYKDLCVELKLFKIMPMHMLFLGVEKSLISKTPTLVDRTIPSQNKFWKSLTASMQSSQSDINSISIEWCKSMAFSGKDSHMIGTAGWQSTHYVAFTRLSLFHFSPMDREGVEIPQAKQEVIRQFKRLRVVWFCLISHLFADDVNIQSSRIDHYVRLFLSSCRRLWQSAQLDFMGDEFNEDGLEGCDRRCDDQDTPGPPKKARKSKSQKTKKSKSKKSDVATEKSKAPFFVSGSNYLSTLNLMNIVDEIETIRGLWEGIHESYIQELKRELSTMRHTIKFLVTLLGKVLRTSMFSSVNEGNPLSSTNRWTRTYNLRIYPSIEEILEQNNIVVGMIDQCGDLYMCVEYRRTDGIALHKVSFDDSSGYWCFDLWYSRMTIGDSSRIVANREELTGMCGDFFVFLHHTDEKDSNIGTIICRSWKVRVDGGKIRLPEPKQETLMTV